MLTKKRFAAFAAALGALMFWRRWRRKKTEAPPASEPPSS